jgi:hypothetical protein
MVGHQNGGGTGGHGGGGGPLGGGGSLADSMSIGTDSRPLSPSGKLDKPCDIRETNSGILGFRSNFICRH